MLLNVDFSFYLLEITLIVIFSNVIISSHYTTEIIVFTHVTVMRTVSSVFFGVLKKNLKKNSWRQANITMTFTNHLTEFYKFHKIKLHKYFIFTGTVVSWFLLFRTLSNHKRSCLLFEKMKYD